MKYYWNTNPVHMIHIEVLCNNNHGEHIIIITNYILIYILNQNFYEKNYLIAHILQKFLFD